MKTTQEQRFWGKVKKEPKCWIWIGAKNYPGYGLFHVGNGKNNMMAHRFSYQLKYGIIKDQKLVVDHICRNHACVNPGHLRLVTSKENILCGIGISAKNAIKTHCKNNHSLSGDNLYLRSGGGRECKICKEDARKRSLDKENASIGDQPSSEFGRAIFL